MGVRQQGGVIAGLDPAIFLRRREMPGSSPGMTCS